jgi:hypothetical protein
MARQGLLPFPSTINQLHQPSTTLCAFETSRRGFRLWAAQERFASVTATLGLSHLPGQSVGLTTMLLML